MGRRIERGKPLSKIFPPLLKERGIKGVR